MMLGSCHLDWDWSEKEAQSNLNPQRQSVQHPLHFLSDGRHIYFFLLLLSFLFVFFV